MMPNEENKKRPIPLPSTFQQVVENMANLQEILPIIEIIKNTILPNLNPNEPLDPKDPNDVVYDPETGTMRVIGVTVVIEYKDEDLPPNGYVHDVTWELKNAEVIGLKGKDGITLDYVTLRTVRMNRAPELGYPTWQCAFGDVGMTMYYRQAISETEWGPWSAVIDLERILNQDPDVFKKFFQQFLEDNPDIFTEIFKTFIEDNPDVFTEIFNTFGHKQIVESTTQPTDQMPGDYWFFPLDEDTPTTAEFAMQSVETNTIEVLTPDVQIEYGTQAVTEGDSEIVTGGDYAIGPPTTTIKN